MRYFVRACIVFLSVLALAGCSQKYIPVQTIAPAQFDKVLDYKRLSIAPVLNDTYQMTHFLEEKLFEKSFNHTPLFQIVSMHEKQPSTASKVDATIVMQIDLPIIYDTTYYVERIRCNDAKCKYPYTIYMPCIERSYSTAIYFQIIDAHTSQLVFSKSLSKSTQDRACQTGGYEYLPDTNLHLRLMQERMVNEFIAIISPTYYKIDARVAFKEPEIDLGYEAQKRLEAGIEALKKNNLSQAKKDFETVLSMSHHQSYAATHNLGLIYEAKGDFAMANTLYNKCLTLLKHPLEHLELQQSLNRIEQTLIQEKIVTGQMQKTSQSLK